MIDRPVFVAALARLRPTPGMWAVAWLVLEGDSRPNVSRLADGCGVSRQTIHNDIRRLEQWGILSRSAGTLACRPPSEWAATAPAKSAPGPRCKVQGLGAKCKDHGLDTLPSAPGVKSKSFTPVKSHGLDRCKVSPGGDKRGGDSSLLRKEGFKTPPAPPADPPPVRADWTPERVRAFTEACVAALKPKADRAEAEGIARRIAERPDETDPDTATAAVEWVGRQLRLGQPVRSSLFGWIAWRHDQWMIEAGGVPTEARRELDQYRRPTPCPPAVVRLSGRTYKNVRPAEGVAR